MSLLFPIGLLALLTLPIIVLLHLLRERRQRVAVPSLMHWQHLPGRPEGERIKRLPLTLLLLLHLLVAGLLGLALAQPQLAGALSGGARQFAIVIDTSTSMAARDGATTRFAQAQARARAAVRGMGAGDSATLVAAGPTARVLARGGKADQAGLLAAIDALTPGGTGADMPGALALAEAAFEGPRPRQIVVLTDGGPQGAGAALPARLASALDWQAIGTAQANHAIVAFAARPWGANVQVYARAANYGPAAFSSRIRLYGDEQLLGTREVALAANGQAELTWTLPAAYARLRATLDGQDALPRDDSALLTLAPPRPIKALLVSAKPDVLHRALAAVPGVRVTVADPASYTIPASQDAPDLTVFDSFLPQSWPDGATLAIHPAPGSALLDATPQARTIKMGALVARGDLLAGLSFGGVNFGPVQPVAPPDWAATLLNADTTPLILRGRNGSHEIAVWTFDLAASNLPARLAFPLLVARTVRDLAPQSLPASLVAGAPLALRPDTRADEVWISQPDGASTTLAAAPTITLDTLAQPGLYQIEERRAGTTLFRGQVAVNAGAPIESDLRPQPAPQIIAGAAAGEVAPQRQLNDLWPWLALGALALLILEWGYIHR